MGSEVVRFGIRDATSKAVEQAAREDYVARCKKPGRLLTLAPNT
jgi:hypothetical protein